MKHQQGWLRDLLGHGLVLAIVLGILLGFPSGATAQTTSPPPVTPSEVRATPSGGNFFLEKLQQLQEDKQLQRLVEEDLEKSIAIREQIQIEVDRAFSHTTALLNVLIALLTSFPILATMGIWFLRRSVISQIVAETNKQLQVEVEKRLEEEVAAELKKQAKTFSREVEQLKAEFVAQLSQLQRLYTDAQQEKDQIIRKLAEITPSPVRDTIAPDLQQKIQELTSQLERLKSVNPQVFLTATDYVEQGRAFYFENRFEEALTSHEKAIQIEPDNARAWFSKGAALAKLQRHEEAIQSYDRAVQLRPDSSEIWFSLGVSLTKLQQYEAAINAHDQALQLKPDFYLAWFGKARCHALQEEPEAMFQALQQALQINPDRGREMLKTDGVFDPWRDMPEFAQLA
ncbi:hypothetical protein BST81_19170 [Leptolyngbya sp. 'hensonii']|uniref:tetratricopeptide repeat protein n=1 Tax=Leptolyngbya sp. 'hensonii' TaxID=1922337 RepID=UPI00094FCAA5|nr:tetratricopeptide repeat protein [Leptolyngbya sp. 'hensonii']OLP16817.1 hypothetical protein BST81_19170 [Leptolyngbya sp. 'hensonii']